MTAKVQRDRSALPALDALMARTADAQLEELAAALAAPLGARGKRVQDLHAVLALALDFWTWSRLTREGLDDAAAADLMAELVAGAASA